MTIESKVDTELLRQRNRKGTARRLAYVCAALFAVGVGLGFLAAAMWKGMGG